MRLHTPKPTSATPTSMSTPPPTPSPLAETPGRPVPSPTSSNNDSPGHASPSTPSRRSIKAVTTTTSSCTRYTRYGVETETTTRTVTTYEDDLHAESPPSPSPVPLPHLSLPLPLPTPPSSEPQVSKQNISTRKVYLAPHPSTLTPIYLDKLYVLTGAEQPGIFKEWKEVIERTEKLGWRIVETRSNWREALNLYTIAYNEGTILMEPVPGSPFANAPYVDVPLDSSVDILPLNTSYPAPHEIEKPSTNTSKFYVVTKGEEAGIFPIWHQAGARTQMVRARASWYKYDTWEIALNVYTAAFNAGTIEVFPRPGGPFDKRASPLRDGVSDPFNF